MTVAETGPTVTIALVDGNNVINRMRGGSGVVTVTGTVTGIAANSSFQVTVTDNGVTKSYTATVQRGRHRLERDDSLDGCASHWPTAPRRCRRR